MSTDLDNLFGTIARAKPISGFAPRLGIGNHLLALKRFQPKNSQQGMGKILEADFMVVESSVYEPGELRGWAWFIDSAGWAGAYEQARAREFLETVAKCIDDDRPTEQIGSDLAGEGQAGKGLQIRVSIVAQTNKDGSAKLGKQGETYTRATWSPVQQGLDDIKAMRDDSEKLDAGNAVAARATQSTPASTPAPATAKRGLGILGSLRK